ncbi:MAG: flagellar filament capping protein FliD [Phycisphaerales bacterium]
MSGITSGTGIFSGIDSASIIDKLIEVESRPKQLAAARIVSLQQQRAAFLDINSRINSLKNAAAKFRLDKIFDKKTATSSNENVLTATTSLGAANGSYTFRVDRLVTTQQDLSRGFADRASTGLGLSTMSFESAKARLDSNVALSDLNGGAGVSRGRIVITDAAGGSATVDLSRAVTVEDVLNAINGNGTAQVTASVKNGSFVIRDNTTGTGTVTIADASGSTTATSLGLAGVAPSGKVVTGNSVYGLNVNTSLASLNDGNGVFIKGNTNSTTFASFTMNVNGTNVNINLADVYELQSGQTTPTKTKSAVSTVGGAITRINEALSAAGFSDVTASVDATNGRLQINAGTRSVTIAEVSGGTTAKDLGLSATAQTGTIAGRRVLAGMNSVLATSLNGGAGVTGNGSINFTLHDGSAFSTTLDTTASLSDMLAAIEASSGTLAGGGAKVSAKLDTKGTGIIITDNTTGSNNLVIVGQDGADTAASLGISTGQQGIAANTKSSGNLQKQYISTSTLLEKLNNGKGIGTGTFRIRDSSGAVATIDIGSDSKTIGDVINEINAAISTNEGGTGTALTTRARINSTGDGIEIYDTGTATGRIKIEDVTGTVGKSLNLVATATGTGVGADNKINGTFERSVTFAVGDTLDEVVRKINDAGVPVTAAVISDGAGSTPFRLALTSKFTGRDGRFIVDSGTVDLGLTNLAKGENALAFFGAGDVANAIAVTSSSNTIDSILPGIKIDLKGTSSDPLQLTVSEDSETLTSTIKEFIDAFNVTIDRINLQTKYDKDTNRKAALLGDGTVIELKSTLARIIQAPAQNLSGRYQRLADVGIKVGKDSKLELDETKFANAMATDPQAVEDLFTNRTLTENQQTEISPGVFVNNPNFGSTFTSLGAMGQIEQLADRYVNSTSGLLTAKSNGLQTQINTQNTRIADMDVRLESKRLRLQRQFAAMESTIGKLQSQGSAISGIGRR